MTPETNVEEKDVPETKRLECAASMLVATIYSPGAETKIDAPGVLKSETIPVRSVEATDVRKIEFLRLWAFVSSPPVLVEVLIMREFPAEKTILEPYPPRPVETTSIKVFSSVPNPIIYSTPCDVVVPNSSKKGDTYPQLLLETSRFVCSAIEYSL